MLGFEKEGARLRLDPCIPAAWPGFSLDYRFGKTVFTIAVKNPDGVSRGVTALTVDGLPVTEGWISLTDDGAPHAVTILLGAVGAVR